MVVRRTGKGSGFDDAVPVRAPGRAGLARVVAADPRQATAWTTIMTGAIAAGLTAERFREAFDLPWRDAEAWRDGLTVPAEPAREAIHARLVDVLSN